MLNRDMLLDFIADAGLSGYADRLLKIAQPAVHLHLQREQDQDWFELGESRTGGSPDLPPGTEWLYWDGKPLTFIAQFRLSDISPLDSTNLLPGWGMLYFFYAVDSQPWGFDPADRGSCRVLYVEDEYAPLERVVHPTADGLYTPIEPFPVCSITCSQTLTMPPAHHQQIGALGFDENQFRNYWDLLGMLAEASSPQHRLLGYPSQIQGDMQLECQLASNGLYVGDSSGYEDPRRAELEPGAKDWRLLFQLDSDEAGFGMMWGDGGMVYYWIQESALQVKDFSNPWLILQCY